MEAPLGMSTLVIPIVMMKVHQSDKLEMVGT